MIHAISFLSTFTIGGLSGIFMANTPVDIFIHDTYFIVAHFHYVVAGIIFAMFAAITYWYPKLFGRLMNERVGRIHAVLTFVFFNLVFFPMHFLGMGGMMRHLQSHAVRVPPDVAGHGRVHDVERVHPRRGADPLHLELRREPGEAGRRP